MQALLLDIGPLAHLSFGEGFLRGQQMLDEENLVLPSGQGILVQDGVIVSIADSNELREEYIGGQKGSGLEPQMIEGINVIEVGGRAIVPGLVDSHTHLLWGGDRSREARWRQQGLSYHEIAKKGGGIAHTVGETRALNENELLNIGQSRIRFAFQNGTCLLYTSPSPRD